MVTAGLEAVLIKVAGMGLTTRHLGQTLAQMQPTLIKLVGAMMKVCQRDLTYRLERHVRAAYLR